jgi:alkaline phosphatase D
MHAALPIICAIDEHDLAGGAWRGGAEHHADARDGLWAERLKFALRARREWLPIRLPDPADPARIHRVLHIGRLMDLYILDTRTQRDEPAPSPRMHDPDRSALGSTQRKWLFSEFSESSAAWRILASASTVGTTWKKELPESARLALAQIRLMAGNSQGPGREQWDGYPAERYLLLRKMRDHKLGNFVVLSGGAQVSLAQELRVDPLSLTSKAVTVECANASVSAQNFDDQMGWQPRTRSIQHEQELLRFFPDMKYLDLDSHGYNIVDVTPERIQVEWWNVATVTRRTEQEWRGAAFQVRSGSPALIPVS